MRTEGSLEYIFTKLAKGKPDNLSLTTGNIKVEARGWFRKKASEISTINNPNLIRKAKQDRLHSNVGINQIGKMLFFQYSAKHHKKLPYWDAYPLIFPIEIYKDGFLGINLHYLPPMYRAKLMDALYTVISDRRYNENTKLSVSYKILKNANKYRYFKPCVKRYLNSHVVSNFVQIMPEEWDMALMLPTERFKKKSKQNVWSESLKDIEG